MSAAWTRGNASVNKALIVYGTRYGTTAETSQVIAETLRQEGFEVEIVDASEHDLWGERV